MTWLPTLIVDTAEDGFQLALKLSRVAVKKTQTDDAVRARLREAYAHDADGLTRASQVVTTNFQTISAANDYWREGTR